MVRVGAGEGKARVVGTPWSRLFKAPPATVAMGPFLGRGLPRDCPCLHKFRDSPNQDDDSDISVAACRAIMALTLRSRSSSS